MQKIIKFSVAISFIGLTLRTETLATNFKGRNILFDVYSNRIDSSNLEVLKLYSDKSYEFLKFSKTNKKKKILRETGNFKIKRNVLTLIPRKGKAKFYHKNKYRIQEHYGLTEYNFIKKNNDLTLSKVNISAYKNEYIIDPIFDTIYNNYYISNKFEKPIKNVVEVKTIEEYNKIYKPRHITNFDTAAYTEKDLKLISRDSLSKLKAVFVLGHAERSTSLFKRDLNEAADYLAALGVKVTKVYPPNTWEQVTKASVNANIFVYSGHGSTAGHNYEGGGICLDDGVWGARHVKDLKLSKNAIVIFNHACFSAGNSASDIGHSVTIEKARARVEDYSTPFLEAGASVYYANNYFHSVKQFLEKMVIGQKLNNIYKYQVNHVNNSVVHFDDLSTFKNNKIAMAGEYDISYAGNPDFTIKNLFLKK